MVKLVKFTGGNLSDVPTGLRNLADHIERGDFGDAHNVAYSVDCGNSKIEIGLLGKAAESGVTAYYLFGLAMRKLEVLK